MLAVRSMMTTTSTGVIVEPCPQGPAQAADTTSPVDPLFSPTTGAIEYGVVSLPVIWTTLHLSPLLGSQEETRVVPAPVKTPAADSEVMSAEVRGLPSVSGGRSEGRG